MGHLDHFQSFLPKENFSKKNVLSHTSTYGPLIPYKVSEKANDEAIPRKLLDRRQDKQMNGQMLIQRTLPATFRGPKPCSFSNKRCLYFIHQLSASICRPCSWMWDVMFMSWFQYSLIKIQTQLLIETKIGFNPVNKEAFIYAQC